MPDNQHPGGVAGRVIEEHEPFARTDPNIQRRIVGMKVLLDFMSAEARAILGELQTRIDTSIEDEGVFHPILSEAYTEYAANRRVFKRLGLDLEESDDTD